MMITKPRAVKFGLQSYELSTKSDPDEREAGYGHSYTEGSSNILTQLQ